MSRIAKTSILLAIAFCVLSAGRLYLWLLNPEAFASLDAATRALALLEGLRFDAATISTFLCART